jgi:Leucine-rich repeat (LRR) protein
MEDIKNLKLKTTLDTFLKNKSTTTFTFGSPEIYGKNKSELKLTESDVNNLFKELIANKEKVLNLYLDGVGITKIPNSINELSNLTFLSLLYNDITNIPDELCSLKNLKTLSLSYNNISALPECIGSMSNLSNLYLSNNPITNLPDSIINLDKLQELNLKDTGIKKTDKNTIEQLENICKKTKNNFYGNKTDKEFYRNPKIYINDIGTDRDRLKNVLSKDDFNNLIRDIPYPNTENTKMPSKAGKKRKTPSRHMSRSSSRRRTRSTSKKH